MKSKIEFTKANERSYDGTNADRYSADDITTSSQTIAKPNVGGSYLYKKMMQIINNPEPLRKPPYSCPMSAYGKSKDCQFPNCTCEWWL